MLKHKHIDKICFGAMAAAVLLTLLLLSGKAPGVSRASASPEYKSRLFDSDRVHTIDIRMDISGDSGGGDLFPLYPGD